MVTKKRLDIILFEKKLVPSREKAKAIIMSGYVSVNGKKITKPGTKFLGNESISIKETFRFVSRGGIKLEKAIIEFKLNINNKVCMDIGASTGGFTDCLLQYGAKKVYAIDVGYGQLDWKLRNNKNVVVIERCNFRYIEPKLIKEEIELIVVDVSFISLKLIIPKAIEFLKNTGEIIALVKPQFEVGKNEVGKGGIVRNSEKHKQVINNLSTFFSHQNLQVINIIESPILGQKGNKEFLVYLKLRR